MMIERPKVTSSGGRMSRAERAVEQEALQRVAGGEHQRHRDQRGDGSGRPARPTSARITKAAKHDEVAMREVDEAHDAEDQRQAGGEERVEAAEQHALDDDVVEADHILSAMT